MDGWIDVYDSDGNLMGVTKAADIAPAAKTDAAPSSLVCKSEEQQFVLGIAYQAGPDPRIAKGVDGGRDWFEPAELEKACWSLARNGPRAGLFHVDGTDANGGAATIVENYIYRNPAPWELSADLVVKQGDWVVGGVLNDQAWSLYKAGRLNGWSPQGQARRIRQRAA
jgi:hypothetical protein